MVNSFTKGREGQGTSSFLVLWAIGHVRSAMPFLQHIQNRKLLSVLVNIFRNNLKRCNRLCTCSAYQLQKGHDYNAFQYL